MLLEKEGVPVVYLLAEGFAHDARSAAEDWGMPTQRQIEMEGYYWMIPAEDSRPIAEAYLDAIIEGLTKPLTEEEANPEQIAKEDYPSVNVTGGSYHAVVDKVNQVFSENHWTDGLAIIPPTREAVDWMLTGTSRSPSEVLGTFYCKLGVATIEKVAINAVMAGARPEYLPVIIAAIEAFGDERTDILHMQASLASPDIMVMVSGPIADEIGMNSGEYYLSYGNRANLTIGRAIRLCLINFGHMWPGINEMGAGRVRLFTGYTLAENYTESPWEPFHVAEGYEMEHSCVTVNKVGGSWRLNTVGGATVPDKLDSIISLVLEGRREFQFKSPNAIPSLHFGGFVFGVTPDVAQELYDMGFTTQEELQNYIYGVTTIPYEDLTLAEIESIEDRIETSIKGPGWALYPDLIPPDDIPAWQAALQPGGNIPILYSPEAITFIVVGPQAAGKVGELKRLEISQWGDGKAIYTWTDRMTKRIWGATLTEAGH